MASEAEEVRDAIVTRLAAVDAFSGIDVLSENRGDIGNLIERQIGAGTGIVAIVHLMEPEPQPKQSDRPLWKLNHTLRFVENVLLNETGKSSLELAERAYAALLYWMPPPPIASCTHLIPEGRIQRLFLAEKPGEAPNEQFTAWEVQFSNLIGLLPHSF